MSPRVGKNLLGWWEETAKEYVVDIEAFGQKRAVKVRASSAREAEQLAMKHFGVVVKIRT